MYPLYAFGSEDQKRRWLPLMAKGEAIGCFALSEPDFGSDPARMTTAAERRGGDWVINGTKMWITNGPIAQVAIVWARTGQGIRGFLVETSSELLGGFAMTRRGEERGRQMDKLPGTIAASVPKGHKIKGLESNCCSICACDLRRWGFARTRGESFFSSRHLSTIEGG
jgi:alkylation response protein AidB-like acyl-CoA dehydrogenase